MDTQKIKNLLLTILPEQQILHGTEELALQYLQEPRRKLSSVADFILFPRTTEEVSNIIKLCNQHNIKVVPQAGNTGLTGGCVASHNSIIINCSNLNKILAINPSNYTISVQSGCILSNINHKLTKYNLLFPLALASDKCCQIGGNIAGNAGGLSALKYGSAGDLVLGLEVVLPNGDIISDLNLLRKRNIGPQITRLFIASEGILGYITAATLKLVPKPVKQLHILGGVNTIEQAKTIFDSLYHKFYHQMVSFEIFNDNSVQIVERTHPNILYPLREKFPWNILTTIDFFDDDIFLLQYTSNKIKNILNSCNINQYIFSYTNDIWQIRSTIPNSQTLFGYSLKHDIAVPLDNIANFVNTVSKKLQLLYHDRLLPIIFGHMGDGNLHYNISLPENNSDTLTFDLKRYEKDIKDLIVDIAVNMKGTFSAEHGIGLINKSYLEKYHSKNQINLLKVLKQTLDKNNIFNYNKIVNI